MRIFWGAPDYRTLRWGWAGFKGAWITTIQQPCSQHLQLERSEPFSFVRETVSNQRPLLLFMPNLHPTDAWYGCKHLLEWIREDSLFRSQATGKHRQLLLVCGLPKCNNGALNCGDTDGNRSGAWPRQSPRCSLGPDSGCRVVLTV